MTELHKVMMSIYIIYIIHHLISNKANIPSFPQVLNDGREYFGIEIMGNQGISLQTDHSDRNRVVWLGMEG